MHHLENLRDSFNNINDWLKFAEAKNFGLLTLNGALAFGITQIGANDEFKCILVTAYYCFIPFAIISFIWCLISLFPILNKIEKGNVLKNSIAKLSNFIDTEAEFENIHYFGYLRNLTLSEFEKKYLSKTESSEAFIQIEKELGVQILYNSRIAWLKYQCFKIGAFFFLIGFLLTVVLSPIVLACR